MALCSSSFTIATQTTTTLSLNAMYLVQAYANTEVNVLTFVLTFLFSELMYHQDQIAIFVPIYRLLTSFQGNIR